MEYNRWRSIKRAWSGILYTIRNEINFRIHLACTILVIMAGLTFSIETSEWLILLVLFALVMSLELINTAIEKLCDRLHPDFDPSIGRVKDISAGAVLISAFFSVIIGAILFYPYIIRNLGIYDS